MVRALAAVAVIVVAAAACHREPTLVARIGYEVDLDRAADPTARAALLARQAAVVRERVRRHGIRGVVVRTEGERLLVELPAMSSEALDTLQALVTRTGALELRIVDDADPAMAAIADHVHAANGAVAPTRSTTASTSRSTAGVGPTAPTPSTASSSRWTATPTCRSRRRSSSAAGTATRRSSAAT